MFTTMSRNRNIYLFIVGIAEVLFFTYTMVLYKGGTINMSDIQMGCIYAGGIGVLAVALAFSKPSWFTKKKEDDFNPALVEVPHTIEGIVFEVLTGLIVIGAWILALAADRFWIIDGFFSFLSPVLMFVMTIIAIIFLWVVYLPCFKPVIRKQTNLKQVALTIRMYRVLAIGFALLVLASALPLGDYLVVLIYTIGAAFLVTIAILRYLIYKARGNSAGFKQSDVQNETTDAFDIDKVKVHRTTLGTAIEVLTVVLIVMAWVVTAINGLFTEDDGSFSIRELANLLTFTILSILMLRSAYRPNDLEREFRISMTNLKQVKLAVIMYHLGAVLTAAALFLSSFPRLHNMVWLWIGVFALALIMFFIFRILIRRARD